MIILSLRLIDLLKVTQLICEKVNIWTRVVWTQSYVHEKKNHLVTLLKVQFLSSTCGKSNSTALGCILAMHSRWLWFGGPWTTPGKTQFSCIFFLNSEFSDRPLSSPGKLALGEWGCSRDRSVPPGGQRLEARSCSQEGPGSTSQMWIFLQFCSANVPEVPLCASTEPV